MEANVNLRMVHTNCRQKNLKLQTINQRCALHSTLKAFALMASVVYFVMKIESSLKLSHIITHGKFKSSHKNIQIFLKTSRIYLIIKEILYPSHRDYQFSNSSQI
jgi:hypothetical protein